jgi:hypothetical protein
MADDGEIDQERASNQKHVGDDKVTWETVKTRDISSRVHSTFGNIMIASSAILVQSL